MSMHPADAAKAIREAAARAMAKDPAKCMFPMPERFLLEASYVRHADALSASFYPGARQTDPKTVAYETDSWMDALRFIHFCM